MKNEEGKSKGRDDRIRESGGGAGTVEGGVLGITITLLRGQPEHDEAAVSRTTACAR